MPASRNPYYTVQTTRTVTTRTTATRRLVTGDVTSGALVTGGFVAPVPIAQMKQGGGETVVKKESAPKEELTKKPEPLPPLAAPGAPVASDATADAIRVTWTNPDPARVTGFRLFCNDGAREPEDFSNCVHNGVGDLRTEYTVSDLRPGEPYAFRVAALGRDGEESDLSAETAPCETAAERAAGKPPGAPAPPVANGSATHDAVPLRWAAPADDGGGSITGYVVERSRRDIDPPAWATCYDDRDDTSTEQTIAGLDASAPYEFRVAAVNSAGMGPFSEPSHPITTEGTDEGTALPLAPEPPVAGEVTANSAQLKWIAPAATAATGDIVGYRVYDHHGSLVHDAPHSAATECVVGGLEPDTEYTFKVAALNTVGEGAASEPSNGVRTDKDTAGGAPYAPVDVVASAPGDRHATVDWTAPDDAGPDPTGYKLYKAEFASEEQANDPEVSEDSELYKLAYDGAGRVSTQTTVRNLEPGTWHRFRVAAQNQHGEGPVSASCAPILTQFCAPSAPADSADGGADGKGLRVDADHADTGPTSARLLWSAPADAGGVPAENLGYVVHRSRHEGEEGPAEEVNVLAFERAYAEDGGAAAGDAGERTAATVSGLQPATAYRFTVAARSPHGTGPASSAVHHTTPEDSAAKALAEEEARKKAEEEEAQKKAAEEAAAQQKAEEEAKAKAEQDAKDAAEADAKRKAELAEQQAAEEEAKKKAEEEAAAKQKAEEEAEAKAKAEREAAAGERRAKLRAEAEALWNPSKPVVGAVIEDEAGFDRVEIVTCKEGGAFHYGKVPEGCCCTHVGGKGISGNKEFKAAVAKYRPGDDVEFTFVWRDKLDEPFKMTVMIGGTKIPIEEVKDWARRARGEFNDDE
eukprot:TRINITY_DN787_c0_g2_i1.p1 TRINITY_DN787_c0_g2~~TRINITY_DN787_c0_g2_i1.p1  ORF type:complete len:866 (-),score=502.99 TRINITY_DN787_c0_g2_i1:211-2808(-)